MKNGCQFVKLTYMCTLGVTIYLLTLSEGGIYIVISAPGL